MSIDIALDPALVAEIDGAERWEVDLLVRRGWLGWLGEEPLGERRAIDPPPPSTAVVEWLDLPRCTVTGAQVYLNDEPIAPRGHWLVRLRAGDSLELTMTLRVAGGWRP